MHRAGCRRRDFLKTLVGAAAGLALGRGAQAAPPAAKPNVLLIVSDDQGAIDLTCYGATDLFTPNLDGLAKQGVRFTQFYSAAPVCAPSRGALCTGRYPQRNGIVRNSDSFNPDETTLAEMFNAAGYATAAIGKWHMGMKTGGPNAEGFDYFFGHHGGCIENYKHNVLRWDEGTVDHHDLWRNTTEVHEDGTHFGELIVREATSFMSMSRADQPFFMYVAFNNPHYPVQPLPQHRERFKALNEPRRSYAAFVATLDDQIGRILAKLDELKLRENTIVIFMADQGHSVESRNALFLEGIDKQHAGGGNAGPYRGHKFTVWEGGIRVPCIVSWPGHVPRGETRGQVASAMDWLPTLAAYTGAALPAKPLDGTSIAGIIGSGDAKSPHEVLHWESNGMWAVREGRWKLVHDGKDLFLSDLEADVTETKNLAADHPEVVQRLQRRHEDWRREVAKRPQSKGNGS